MKRLVLKKEECYKSLVDFYDGLAEMNGVDTEKVQYDVRKVCCTKAVADAIFQFYKERGHCREQVGTFWLFYGPKANLEEEGCVVELEEGFFSV